MGYTREEDAYMIVNGTPSRNVHLEIDSSSLPRSLYADLKESERPVTISRIDPGLTSLVIGPLLAESLVGPLVLPWALETYRGPVFHDTVLPLTLKNLGLVQSFSSAPAESIYIPTGVQDITIATRTRVSNVDRVNLPDSVHTLRIEGPFNASLDSLDTKNVTRVVLPEAFRQPVDSPGRSPPEILDGISADASGIYDGIPVVRGEQETAHLLRYLPRLNHLHVILNDDIRDFVDVWTRVLFEGRVRVRSIVVDAEHARPGTDVLRGMYVAIDRAVSLGRPVCRHLVVRNIPNNRTHVVSYYKLAESLTRLHEIEVVLSHKTPVPDLAPRIAGIMGLTQNRYDESIQRHVYYRLFGVIATEVYVSGCDTIHIVKGQGALVETRPTTVMPAIPVPPVRDVDDDESAEGSVTEPSSSSLPLPYGPEPVTKTRPIVLYSWTECGYCKKQEEIIQAYREGSVEDASTFDDIVEVRTITDPSDIADKRIVSFPTWVTGDAVIPGVRDAEGIRSLINAKKLY